MVVTQTKPQQMRALEGIPPQSIEAEQSTLGSMMLSRDAIIEAAAIIKEEDFYRPSHGAIFDAIVTLEERDEPVDLITIQEELRKRKQLDAVGGTEYLMSLIATVPSASRVEHYAQIVEEKAIKRKILDSARKMYSLAVQDDLDGQLR
jgi:replicative DNA helicase